MRLWILRDRLPVEVTVEEWAPWFEKIENRRVAFTESLDFRLERRGWRRVVAAGWSVSTVFLGIDHGWGEHPAPVLFETLITGGPLDGCMERTCTWDGAEAAHRRMVAAAQAGRLAPRREER